MGNAILGREAFKESRTRKSEIQRGRIEDRNVSIIDTPGFFNTQLTDEELQKQMMKSLVLSDPGPHVFLLIFNLKNFEEDERNIVEKIEEIFGAQALKFTVVIFTGREQMSSKEWKEFILSEKFQGLVSNFRVQYHEINSKDEIDQIHIKKLLMKIDELIEQNDGQHYNNKSTKEKKNQDDEKNYRKKEQEQERPEQGGSRCLVLTTVCLGLICVLLLVAIIWQHSTITEHRDLLKNCKNTVEKLNQTINSLREHFPDQITEKDQWHPFNENIDLRIMVVGKTGAGKSASGNTILGEKVFEEKMSSESVTETCQKHQKKVKRGSISVIDTPGMFDTKISEKQLKDEIEKCVNMSVPGPYAFLLVIRLDVRFTDEEKKTVKWIQKNFGEKAADYSIILFTRGDQIHKPIEEFLNENRQIEELVGQCKSRYHVFNNKDKNPSQVNELLDKIVRIVMENGGEHYTNEMYKEVLERQRKEDERQRLEEEENMKMEARKRQREEDERKLKEEKNKISEEYEKQLKKAQNESENCKKQFKKESKKIIEAQNESENCKKQLEKESKKIIEAQNESENCKKELEKERKRKCRSSCNIQIPDIFCLLFNICLLFVYYQ